MAEQQQDVSLREALGEVHWFSPASIFGYMLSAATLGVVGYSLYLQHTSGPFESFRFLTGMVETATLAAPALLLTIFVVAHMEVKHRERH